MFHVLLRLKFTALVVASVLILSTASSWVGASPERPSLAAVTRWVDLLGANEVELKQSGQWENLTRFELVVVDVDATGGNFTEEAVAQLKSEGVLVLSYLNLGACEQNRWYWETECASHVLGPYENYPGEFWMNVSTPSWHDAVVDRIAASLFAKGIDGFYLDNLDIVEVFHDAKGLTAALHEIIVGLRVRYPSALLVGQNGLAALNDTSVDAQPVWSRLDALAHEDVFATYDFERALYVPQVPARTAELVAKLSYFGERGIKIFTVDYADTENLARSAIEAALANNFTPYVGPIDLDSVAWWAYFFVIPEFSGSFVPLALALAIVAALLVTRAKFISRSSKAGINSKRANIGVPLRSVHNRSKLSGP